MKKLLLFLLASTLLLMSSANAQSERFYEDETDVTDDNQIHFNYIITKNDENRE